MYEVNIVNPAQKKKRKKRMAKAKKKKSTKRRSNPRRAPAAHAAPKKRRAARRSNPGHRKSHRRSRRRRNPGLGIGSIGSMVKGAVPAIFGQVAVAAAAKFAERWGGKSSGGAFSPTYGEPWTWQQYAAAAAVALFAPKFVGRWVNAHEFQKGAMQLIIGKGVWTEGLARMPALQQYLGEVTDGSTTYDPSGQGWMAQDGQYVAMQGLVDQGPLDGMGNLVEQSRLDGVPDYRYGTNSDPYAA